MRSRTCRQCTEMQFCNNCLPKRRPPTTVDCLETPSTTKGCCIVPWMRWKGLGCGDLLVNRVKDPNGAPEAESTPRKLPQFLKVC